MSKLEARIESVRSYRVRCPHCDSVVSAALTYCGNCGERLHDEADNLPPGGTTIRVDRSNEPGYYVGVVEDVADTSHGGRMLVRCTESETSKAHPEMTYSVGVTADWEVVQ